jgi:signal transduction histidine kinase
MSFKVAARTILQLGAELISSDGIAFYELIKNAFDAGSATVEIDIRQRVSYVGLQALRHQLHELKAARGKHSLDAATLRTFRAAVETFVDATIPGAPELLQKLRGATSWTELGEFLDDCNTITISDSGSGMTAKTLDDIYLTIGTRSRLIEREQRRQHEQEAASQNQLGEAESEADQCPILGEKGLGRLSAMRLGDRLRVETTVPGEKHTNLLQIDWRRFSHTSDELIGDIDIAPEIGPQKSNPSTKGTALYISALTADWTHDKIKEIASHEFSKLIDPFVPASRYKIVVRYNGINVPLPPLSDLLFEYAHAVVTASYTVESGSPQLVGRVHYRMRNREKPIIKNLAELVSLTKVSAESLVSLGPFDMTLYWYNRQLLRRELSSIGEKQQVLDLETEWSGGLKLYRDGFRVNPYGNKDDDWLDLDRKALASGGYKVNRTQIVGRVRITSDRNPALTDQTNREGVRDCPEKRALVAVLKSILEADFRTFLNAVDDELRAKDPLTFEDLGKRVLTEEQQIRRSLAQLVERHPEIKNETQVVQIVEQSAQRIRDLMESAQTLADQVEAGHSQFLHLAGLGLMVEILAHELTRTTQNTLHTVTNAAKTVTDRKLNSIFRTLESQLKTLEKRLRVLDPLSVSGRQRKEEFDIVSWLDEVLVSHGVQFSRHNIHATLNVLPKRPPNGLRIKAVKGMIVQIMENLFSNSVYWLKVQRQIQKNFDPSLIVDIDIPSREIRITDNGPGIEPRRAEEVFQPFVTSKPPGEGKGLGLYISREIAQYHGASLTLSPIPTVHKNRLNTFVLRLSGEAT